jgi:hypothetical protein
MRCGERRKVTGFLWPEIEDIKEKSRRQICADGGNQRSTRKTWFAKTGIMKLYLGAQLAPHQSCDPDQARREQQ